MGVKKMVIKYVVKKAFVLLLVAFIFMTHLSLCVSADNAYGSSEKLDYAGLLTRMDKYQKYSGYGKLFDHSTKIMLSGYGYDACGGFLKYSDVSDLDWESNWDRYFFQAVETGFPESYYRVRWSGISKSESEEAMLKYCVEKNMEYAGWAVKAYFSDDPRTVIETFMSPEYIVDMDRYNSDEPKLKKYTEAEYSEHYANQTFFADPKTVLCTSLDTLDRWGYSDEYWYDYYSFIGFLNTDAAQRPEYEDNAIARNASMSGENAAELARRLALYSERVGKSPDTGDAGGARVAFLAATTVLAAIIPAGGLTVWRRRKREL